MGDLDGIEHIIILDARNGKTLHTVCPEPIRVALDAQVDEALLRFDRNGDGALNEQEALQRFGWGMNFYDEAVSQPLSERTRRLMAALDTDGEEGISLEEGYRVFGALFSRIDRATLEGNPTSIADKRAKKCIEMLDANRDGSLSTIEVAGTSIGRLIGHDVLPKEIDKDFSESEIIAAFLSKEPGRDGIISFDELQSFYEQEKALGDGVLTRQELRSQLGGFRHAAGDGPRSTPTVDGGVLFALGGTGDISCVEISSGSTLWHRSLFTETGAIPDGGYTTSLLVIDDLLIVAAGGKDGTLLALDKRTGKDEWRTNGVVGVSCCSAPVVATIRGIRQIVQASGKSVCGLSMRDGQRLWRYPLVATATSTGGTCPPIVFENKVLVTNGYGDGSGLLQITSVGSKLLAQELYFQDDPFCDHASMALVGDYVYGASNGSLACWKFGTGKKQWQVGGVGKGTVSTADGTLYIQGEDQSLVVAEANPNAYVERGRFKIPSQRGCLTATQPVVSLGRLYVRAQNSLTAYDLTQKKVVDLRPAEKNSAARKATE